jgi:hypothetical protein
MPFTGALATIEAAIEQERQAMAEIAKTGVPWRVVGWGGAVALLAVPFLAMGFTSEVNWTASDFTFAGVLLAVIGGGFELAVKMSSNVHYRLGAALALLATLLTIWANLAVGIVGSNDNPANLWFFAALLLGILASMVGRFSASGMSVAAFATAVALWVAFSLAVVQPTDEPLVKHSVEFTGISIFALLFIGSGALFRRAAKA